METKWNKPCPQLFFKTDNLNWTTVHEERVSDVLWKLRQFISVWNLRPRTILSLERMISKKAQYEVTRLLLFIHRVPTEAAMGVNPL